MIEEKDIIIAENLTKEYITSIKFNITGQIVEGTTIKALDSVNFKIKEGEFIAIMGPSGAGKSTFLNLLSTVDTQTKGRVYIDGQNINKLSDRKVSNLRYKTIGFVYQEFNLIDGLTIRENIGIPLTLAKENKDYIEERMLNISKRLGIEDLLDKYPLECSGGQIQRVAIARALIAKPKIIIADEPTGNLDSKNSSEVMKLFKELNDEGITILMVTHDAVVASFSKKVINIKDGKIEKTLEKNSMAQSEFFHEILKVVSEEAVFID
ncbi:ABC transporter ATP-binding protein [Clostridium chrysemydis]|uniref:ABC transporter ATP-binding protein n=1 Tax=Clostridium chrysemydis TaxID=2665504 RepID=UPI00188329E9|nr:ABC transporter ATP-binding protein [Clostridium chrysemydis]